jgi:hypothetical protein
LVFTFGERHGCEGDERFTLAYIIYSDKQLNSYSGELASATTFAMSGNLSSSLQVSGDE